VRLSQCSVAMARNTWFALLRIHCAVFAYAATASSSCRPQVPRKLSRETSLLQTSPPKLQLIHANFSSKSSQDLVESSVLQTYREDPAILSNIKLSQIILVIVILACVIPGVYCLGLRAGAQDSNTGPFRSEGDAVRFVTSGDTSRHKDAHNVDFDSHLCIVIFGATGDLAKKKLFPALYQLLYGAPDAALLPVSKTSIIGVGRSAVAKQSFIEKQCKNVKGSHVDEFFSQISYFQGSYDKEEDFVKLNNHLQTLEGNKGGNRLFFLSVPPTVFGQVCENVKRCVVAPSGHYTRLIIEKPFGRDAQSFAELDGLTSKLFREDQLFRIDHYLGKEVVLNLVALRFGNQFLEPLWNRAHIASFQLVFKEDLGTGGRGGYFDNFGIIRDIMQNHLMQVFLWLAMEPPSSLTYDKIQQEKVRLLKATQTLSLNDCFLGQFTGNTLSVNGKEIREPGYLEDPTVPEGSRCPTYAAVRLQVDNERWRGVPFIMRAGKGLDERLAEVRVTFKEKRFNKLIPGVVPNELVFRIQPDESVYLKFMNKVPGWEQGSVAPACLDMSYRTQFSQCYVADAYERMFLNAAKGDKSLFVGNEELVGAWRIFTPLLTQIDTSKPAPVPYPFGSRVPDGMDAFMDRFGIVMSEDWQERLAEQGKSDEDIRALFNKLDSDGDGALDKSEIKKFAQVFYDGREPPDEFVNRIIGRLDMDGDGRLSLEELQQGILKLQSWCMPHHKIDHGTFYHAHGHG